MTSPDAGLIAAIERRRADARTYGRRTNGSSWIMGLLERAAEPIEGAPELLRRLSQVNSPGGCFSAAQGAHLARTARDLEQRLADLHVEGGPHEALLGLILVVYRQLAALRADSALLPEEDAEITDALRRYAESEG